MLVNPETLVCCIVILIHRGTSPLIVALYAKVVIALSGHSASACTTLQQSLSQRDRGRNVVLYHLLYGEILILVYVSLICRVPLHLGIYAHNASRETDKNGKQTS